MRGVRTEKGRAGGTHSGTGIAEWPFIFSHIATATGWSFTHIDRLTLWDVNDLFCYWQNYPPTHVLVAAYLLGDRKRSSSHHKNGYDAEMLRQKVISVGGTIRRGPPPILN